MTVRCLPISLVELCVSSLGSGEVQRQLRSVRGCNITLTEDSSALKVYIYLTSNYLVLRLSALLGRYLPACRLLLSYLFSYT